MNYVPKTYCTQRGQASRSVILQPIGDIDYLVLTRSDRRGDISKEKAASTLVEAMLQCFPH